MKQTEIEKLIAHGWSVVTEDCACKDGDKLLVLEGAPVISQSGGQINTWGTSAPVISKI